MNPVPHSPADRRTCRKKAFRRAALIALCGLVAGAVGVTLGLPALGLVLALAGFLLAWRALRKPGGVPILVYHSVSPDAGWLPWARNISVRPEVLDIHLRTLRRDGWNIVSTEDLVAARANGASLPPQAVVLQFDDAYLDNYLFAAPILRRHNAPATIFASVDFVEPGEVPRGADRSCGPEAWQGYMNVAELRHLDADPLFAVEAHGTNHARIPVSDRTSGLVGLDWKRHAPLTWATDPENKSRWFEAVTPPPSLRPDASLPETDSALAGRWWRDGSAEDEAAFRARVSQMLSQAYRELAALLDRAPRVMAWPFDRFDPVSVDAAQEAGFVAVTGGRQDNRREDHVPGNGPVILSRVHLQDRAFGGGPLWLEALALRARVNTAAGWLVWHPVTALANRLRRRRLGPSGYDRVAS